MQSGFTSDLFLWKRTGLAKGGGLCKRHKFRAKQGSKSKGGRRLGWPEGQEHQERESLVLRTYTVDGMRVKKLHID